MKLTPIFLCALIVSLTAFSQENAVVGVIESTTPAGWPVQVQSDQSAGKEVKGIEGKVGTEIHLRDHVLARPGQTVVVKLKDSSEVTASPEADLIVSDFVPDDPKSTPHVQLLRGRALFQVQKKIEGQSSFFIRTQSATMGVRGTTFVVDLQAEGETNLHTLEGKVAMAKTESELAQPGKSVLVEGGRTSTITPSMNVPRAPKKFNRRTYLNNLKKSDPAFFQAVRSVLLTHVVKKVSLNRHRLEGDKPAKQVRHHRRPRGKKQ